MSQHALVLDSRCRDRWIRRSRRLRHPPPPSLLFPTPLLLTKLVSLAHPRDGRLASEFLQANTRGWWVEAVKVRVSRRVRRHVDCVGILYRLVMSDLDGRRKGLGHRSFFFFGGP